MRKVTERIIELGDKKELVTQEDLPYIVSDVLKHGAIGEKVKLKSYFVNLAHGLKPMATLKIEINGKSTKRVQAVMASMMLLFVHCVRYIR